MSGRGAETDKKITIIGYKKVGDSYTLTQKKFYTPSSIIGGRLKVKGKITYKGGGVLGGAAAGMDDFKPKKRADILSKFRKKRSRHEGRVRGGFLGKKALPESCIEASSKTFHKKVRGEKQGGGKSRMVRKANPVGEIF